ncbi:MAG: VOC family protein [Casimicrobiaceae bacterium]
MPRPIHFEIHPADPQRAIAFYAALIGWLACLDDTEGNILGVMQMDETAK